MSDYAEAYWADQKTARADTAAQLTVYEKTTCSNCKRLARILTERGIDFERVDYHVEPLPAERIRELLRKAGMPPREALRTKEPAYRELGLDAASVSE